MLQEKDDDEKKNNNNKNTKESELFNIVDTRE